MLMSAVGLKAVWEVTLSTFKCVSRQPYRCVQKSLLLGYLRPSLIEPLTTFSTVAPLHLSGLFALQPHGNAQVLPVTFQHPQPIWTSDALSVLQTPHVTCGSCAALYLPLSFHCSFFFQVSLPIGSGRCHCPAPQESRSPRKSPRLPLQNSRVLGGHLYALSLSAFRSLFSVIDSGMCMWPGLVPSERVWELLRKVLGQKVGASFLEPGSGRQDPAAVFRTARAKGEPAVKPQNPENEQKSRSCPWPSVPEFCHAGCETSPWTSQFSNFLTSLK